PLTLWIKKLRRNIYYTFVVALIINIGMWFERFDIIVLNLHHDRLPSGWAMFQPTFIDIGLFIGTVGFFSILFLLYARTFPVIPQAEIKTILKSSGEHYKALRAERGDDTPHLNPGTVAPEPAPLTSGAPILTPEERAQKTKDFVTRLGIFDKE